MTADHDRLARSLAASAAAVERINAQHAPQDAHDTILPPPRAVVSAAYLTVRTQPDKGDRAPGIILEVCPACTARLPLSERQCSCRVPCTWDGCHYDDPMTKLVTGRE